jgi:hypothetical protein
MSHNTGIELFEKAEKQCLEDIGGIHGNSSLLVRNITRIVLLAWLLTLTSTFHSSLSEITFDTLIMEETELGISRTHRNDDPSAIVPFLHLPHPSTITVLMSDGSMHFTHELFLTSILSNGQHSPVGRAVHSQPKGSELLTSALTLSGKPPVALTRWLTYSS